MSAEETPAADAKAERVRVAGEQRRLDHAAQVELRAREAELALASRRAELEFRRQERARRREERNKRRADRQRGRAARLRRLRVVAPQVARTALVVVPIVAPMSVAWVGQISFACHTLRWPLVAGIAFAAAWELTVAFCAWMHHQARTAGDGGTLFRVATVVFAVAAATMNYWHAAPSLVPNPIAVSYGAMSLVGIAVWELYALLTHRRAARARGALPPARPRFGVVRWVRYPRETWEAWSLAIAHEYTTTGAALIAARLARARREAAADTRPRVVVMATCGPVKADPAALPELVAVQPAPSLAWEPPALLPEPFPALSGGAGTESERKPRPTRRRARSSRVAAHRAPAGLSRPSVEATDEELLARARELGITSATGLREKFGVGTGRASRLRDLLAESAHGSVSRSPAAPGRDDAASAPAAR